MQNLLKAGAAVVDISPKKGIQLSGYPHYTRKNTGIHDPLYAGCIYLDNGSNRIAIVCMDFLTYSKKYVKEVRKKASSCTKLKPEQIMISFSHSHSSPRGSGRLDMEEIEKGNCLDENYLKQVEEKIVDIIKHASCNTFNAKIGIEKGVCGKEKGIGGNRRDPDGISDPAVWTIGIKDNDDNWKACLVRYSLHPTVLHEDNTLVSADYPGYIRKYLKKTKLGMEFLFAQGLPGDQSSRYFRNSQNFIEAKRIGYAIGEEASDVLDSMDFSSRIKILSVSQELEIELKELPPIEKIKQAIEKAKIYHESLQKAGAPPIDIQNAWLNLLGHEDTLAFGIKRQNGVKIEIVDEELPVEIQIIGIGDARIVGIQGELFAELGLEIEKKSPFEKTFVVGCANGVLPGYAYTEKAYREGGYETGASLLTAKSGKQIVNAAIRLLKKT